MRMKTEAKTKLSLDDMDVSSQTFPLIKKKVGFIYENSLISVNVLLSFVICLNVFGHHAHTMNVHVVGLILR